MLENSQATIDYGGGVRDFHLLLLLRSSQNDWDNYRREVVTFAAEHQTLGRQISKWKCARQAVIVARREDDS